MTALLKPLFFQTAAVAFVSLGLFAAGAAAQQLTTGQRADTQSADTQSANTQSANTQSANTQSANTQSADPQSAFGQNQVGPQSPTAQAPMQTVPINAPAGFPLDPKLEGYVDGVLGYWETSSSQVERLRCQFNRFNYDSGVCNYVDPATGQMVPHEIAGGQIQYENPDRAIIAVDKKRIALPPSTANPTLDYRDVDGATMEKMKERYVSSGDAIYFFDYSEKQLIKQNLPPELQGQGIKNSPLPFLFGAKAADLKARYWIKPVTPAGVEKQWWLEIYPKLRKDAEHYSKAIIVLAGDEFLPIQIQLYAPDHNPQKIMLTDGTTHPAVIKFQIYDFASSEKNFDLGLNVARLWRDEFSPRPQTLLGWKLVEKAAPSIQQAQTTDGTVPR